MLLGFPTMDHHALKARGSSTRQSRQEGGKEEKMDNHYFGSDSGTRPRCGWDGVNLHSFFWGKGRGSWDDDSGG